MRSPRQIPRACAPVLLFVASLGFALAAPAPPPRPAAPAVLVLLSRNLSDPWIVAQVAGMQRVFAASKPPVAAAVEYLDWQAGVSGPEQEEKLAAYYASKFPGQEVRVVVAVENPAIEFTLHRRDTLFPRAQAVFSGIPRFDETRRPAWATGQLENSDPAGTFLLARRLQPGMKRFVILDDRAGTGATAHKMILNAVPGAEEQVQLEVALADTVQEIYALVETLPPEASVLLTKSRLASHLMDELRHRSPVAVYGTRSPTQLPAILGGSLLDGERAGAAAAQRALRLLEGEAASEIPFEPNVPRRLVVDFRELERFGIPLERVPAGCEVHNRVPSFWERHQRVLIASGVVIAVLGALAAGLFVQLGQKRAALRRLDRSLSVLSATFDSIADGVLVVDREGRVSGSNERFLTLWGIPRELAARGKDEELLQFVLEQLADPAAFLARVQELYARPGASVFDVIAFKDGRVFERDSRPQLQGGEVVGRVWSFRDVTARHRAEAERERLAAQLAQAQKMEALGTLAGGIAHDFNNMLTGILGCSQLALERLPPTHPAAEELRQVIEAGERAGDLVRQILTFSRKRAPERKVISLEPIVRDTLRLLRATAPAAIELAAELHPGVPPVLADPAQMHQALLNLCTNALHAMGRGPGELRVLLTQADPAADVRAAHPDLPAGPLVALLVSDTGHGMDAETLARVFEPFYSTKETGEGTGLGLAVVHGIVQAHEGAITVRSELGRGTTFTLCFPPSATPAAAPAAKSSAAPQGQSENILIVDDEPIVCEVAAAMLRRLGYQPHICPSAERALELVQSEPGAWALVFTDLNMPRITGLDLIRRLRDAGCAVPCLLTTGFVGSGATEAEARALGVTQIVEKPFTEHTLGLAISVALAAAPACTGGVPVANSHQ